MYGVVEQCGEGKAIKKPWSFLSWNLGKLKELELKCDGSHEHAPCAGRETTGTVVYSPSLCRRLVEYRTHGFKTCHFEGVGNHRMTIGSRITLAILLSN